MLEIHEKRLDDHDKRIVTLERSTDVMGDNLKQIRYWAGWGIGILAASFLLQLADLIMKK